MNDISFANIINESATYKGLTSKQASEALKEYGFNERPRLKKKNWFKRFWRIVSEPMMALIFITAIIYFFIGEKLDGVILIFSLFPIVFFEYLQENRTDKAIEALDNIMIDHCRVYRDGEIVEIETKMLVPGDLVYLTAGDKIPADGYLLNSSGLQIDESMLTGESVSVVKAQAFKFENLKEENYLFQATLLTTGEGYMLVEKTGVHTSYGKLGNLLENINQKETPLQKKIHRLVKGIAMLAFLVSAAIAIILTHFYGITDGVLGALTIAMALIPEEFPVVFSVFLIMGVWRMSKQNAMVREMEMVETLGSATVICTDKTGTLTEGRMSLVKVFYKDRLISMENKIKDKSLRQEISFLLNDALLALERVAVDPIETEVQRFAENFGFNLNKFYGEKKLLADSSFNSETKMVHHIWREQNNVCNQYTAGAPEMVIKSCDLTEIEKEKLNRVNEDVSSKGLRVIAVAKRICNESGAVELSNLDFVGFLIMRDPPRAGVKEAVKICQNAGIRIIMLTGDNKLTAKSIAKSIGLNHNEKIFSDGELELASDEELCEIVKKYDIFARVRPEHKYRIVEALQKNGEVVAMTGDGVNDAPALKKANIGVAMGQRGTEVARFASGIVLLDDNFSTIVQAVREGRRIYYNMKRAFLFLFSFHLPIMLIALIPLLFGEPLIFAPIHIIFLELICDPVSVLGFEKEKARKGLMTEKPRPSNEPLVNPRLWFLVLIQGLSITALCLAFYYLFGIKINNLDLGRTVVFAVLVWSQILLILFSREWAQVKSNRLMLYLVLILLGALMLVLSFSAIRNVFHFVAIPLNLSAYLIFIPVVLMFFLGLVSKNKKLKV